MVDLGELGKKKEQGEKDQKEKDFKATFGQRYTFKEKCKRCHGRGYTGYDVIAKVFLLCGCARRSKEEG